MMNESGGFLIRSPGSNDRDGMATMSWKSRFRSHDSIGRAQDILTSKIDRSGER